MNTLTIRNYIGGRLVNPRSGKFLEVFEPATGRPYGQCPDSDAEDVDDAVDAAELAFDSWRRRSAANRGEFLRAISRDILEHQRELARDESMDSGKALRLAAIADVPKAAQNFALYAAVAEQMASDAYRDGAVTNITSRAPLGVVGCISPWNFPLYLFTLKIAPALAAGNTVVAKPSELTPLTAYRLSQAAIRVGLPAGVLNIVHGRGEKVGASIVRNRAVRAVGFTGSTRTGRDIAIAAAAQFKKVALEMGGKNPTIVCADADLSDENMEVIVRSAFVNQGEVCLAGSRILVDQRVYAGFRDRLVERVSALEVGDPYDIPADGVGALVSDAHMDKVLNAITSARESGGSVLTGGGRAAVRGRCGTGWFVDPTLIDGLGPEATVNREEIFGPVATLIPFGSEDEAVRIANSVDYGLTASIWTSDLRRSDRIASQLECGVVWINCWQVRDQRSPFGGLKQSGNGTREGGRYAIDFYSEMKNVCTRH